MIRPMESSDLDRVSELEQICFHDAWSREDLRRELEENPYAKGIVLEEDGKVIGYAYYWIVFEISQLSNIAVDPAFRSRGFGRRLLEQALKNSQAEGCENMTLEVRVGNEAAKKLYESMGFVGLHVSKKYYTDGEDALVMGIGI